MRITFIVENHRGDNTCNVEHGLSQWIEVDGKNILFDCGESKLYLKNANKLGIDLSTTNYIVLSHGHFDHGAGLDYFPNKKPLILHSAAFTYRTFKVNWQNADIVAGFQNLSKGHRINYSGILSEDKANEKFDVIKSDKPYQITENTFFLGEIPRKFDFENEGEFSDLPDDSAIAVKTENGIVVTSGCAHSGICNTIEYAKEVCCDDRVYAVLGGFHLDFQQKGVSEKATKTIEYFNDNKIQKAYLGHCTSDEVISAFKQKLPKCKVGTLFAGFEMNF